MSNIPNRRSTRISNPKPSIQVEDDYYEEGDDMDSDDRDKDDDVKILSNNPKKRKAAEELTLGRSIEKTHDTLGPQPQSPQCPIAPALSPPRRKNLEVLVDVSGGEVKMERRRTWR